MSRRCGICKGEGHNRQSCARRAATANVITFTPTQQTIVVEKHIKPSMRDLCIGDDLAAVRLVCNRLSDVQYETILDEGIAVARSRKWESIILAIKGLLDRRKLEQLVKLYKETPVIVVTSTPEADGDGEHYIEAGVLAYFAVADIASGYVDLYEWVERAIAYKTTPTIGDKRDDKRETLSWVATAMEKSTSK